MQPLGPFIVKWQRRQSPLSDIRVIMAASGFWESIWDALSVQQDFSSASIPIWDLQAGCINFIPSQTLRSAVLIERTQKHMNYQTGRQVPRAQHIPVQQPVDHRGVHWQSWTMGSSEIHRKSADYPQEKVRHSPVGPRDPVQLSTDLCVPGLLLEVQCGQLDSGFYLKSFLTSYQ